jgi:hypothetical protein
MTQDDMLVFSKELRATAAVFGRRLDAEMVDVYFRVCESLPLAAVVRAIRQFARTAESGQHFPTPAELARRTGGVSGPEPERITPEQLPGLRDCVFAAMSDWDPVHTSGSAWPAFREAWNACCRGRGVNIETSVLARDTVWREWLDAGTPLTRAAADAILADVEPRGRPGPFLDALRQIRNRLPR